MAKPVTHSNTLPQAGELHNAIGVVVDEEHLFSLLVVSAIAHASVNCPADRLVYCPECNVFNTAWWRVCKSLPISVSAELRALLEAAEVPVPSAPIDFVPRTVREW